MLKRLLPLLFAVSALAGAAVAADKQPVLIVLYTRFYDHSHKFPNNQRIDLLIPLLEKLRAKYPSSGVSGLFEFSGSMSQVFSEENLTLHLVDKVKDAGQRGLIDIGYTGEDEPSYLYRPKAELLTADTPEKRWVAEAEAANHFLTDFKDPVTGRPVPGLTGGLQRMQEVFGPAAFIRGVTDLLGGDSPVTNEVRRLNATAVLRGLPPSDKRRGLEAYTYSSSSFSSGISPLPTSAPEVFWEDGAIRLSDVSLPDNIIPHSTDETAGLLKRIFDRLDRSKVRVIALEMGSYNRYLTKRTDGSLLWDPMEWLYYHPDHPDFPPTIAELAFRPQRDVHTAYANEEEVLTWLLQEFFPANPGSRFVSVRDLVKMAGPELPAEVDWNQIKDLASDFDRRFRTHPTRTSDFLQIGDRFFTNAEAFELMTEALASADKTGTPAPSVRPYPIHGPIGIPDDMGPVKGAVKVQDVLEAAARIAPSLRNTEWKQLPENAVPAYVDVGSLRVNAAQFLRLMASACMDLSPDKVLTLSPIDMHTDISFRYPRTTPNSAQGTGWTFKPAPLGLASTGASAASR